jgi:hypothetical protein
VTEHRDADLAAATSTDATVELLRGRILAMVGRRDAETVAARVSLADGGLVVTGDPKLGVIARLRRSHPDLLLAQDPGADRDWHAEPDAPFSLGEPDLFGAATMDRALDAQIEAGASFALTPTRHVRAGDADSLKAIQRAAERISRTDVVVRVPVDAAWGKPTQVRQLIAVLSRIEHPVALSLASTKDPMDGRGVVAAIRDLTLELPHVALWFSDLCAIAHVCDGGLAGAVGFLPSLRHGAIPGKSGFAQDKSDRTPHILIPGWLRYMRGSKLEDTFAGAAPPYCPCSVCGDRPLDRFSGSDVDRMQAHAHNVAVLMDLAAEMSRTKPALRMMWWREQLAQAAARHAEAEEATGRHLALPPLLLSWMRLHDVAS